MSIGVEDRDSDCGVERDSSLEVLREKFLELEEAWLRLAAGCENAEPPTSITLPNSATEPPRTD